MKTYLLYFFHAYGAVAFCKDIKWLIVMFLPVE